MLEKLRSPMTAGHLILAATAVTASITLYCLVYTRFAGNPETVADAAGWAMVNVLPWLFAFELGKRQAPIWSKLLVVGAATAVSLTLGGVLGHGEAFGFELVRRIPAALLVLALFAATSLPTRRERAAAAATPGELPLCAETIDWVGAAGNYVELHGRGRVIVHRAPLSLVEAQLAPRGFIRVHRSTLVRRDTILRVRPLDIVLRDGTMLKTGSRYRAGLGSQFFVPSSPKAGEPERIVR